MAKFTTHGFMMTALLAGGCTTHHQPVDILAELEGLEFGQPTCPRIELKNGEQRLLKAAQVFDGPRWEMTEIIPFSGENSKAKLSMWVVDERWYSYLIVKCYYHDMEDAVVIDLPNVTRYCVSVQVKEEPPRIPLSFAFWCIPSQIYDQSGVENFPPYSLPYAPPNAPAQSDGDS